MERTDPRARRYYYVHLQTGESTWTKPIRGQARRPDADAAEDTPASHALAFAQLEAHPENPGERAWRFYTQPDDVAAPAAPGRAARLRAAGDRAATP